MAHNRRNPNPKSGLDKANRVYDAIQGGVSTANLRSYGDGIVFLFKKMQFGSKAQLAFLEDLYTLVNDGIPPNRAIDMIAQVTTGISKDVARSISKKIGEGQALAEGMKDWFSPNIIEIIRVGEEGGALAQTMKSAINTLTQTSSSLGAILTAVIYPLMVITMACGLIMYLDKSVFAQFRLIKPIEQWPEAGRTLIFTSGIIHNWWWAVVVTIIVLIVVTRRIMTNYIGDFRIYIDNIFPFSIYRRFVAARFLETLGLLVSNGVVFKTALKVMRYQANPYLNSHLIIMEHLLGMGKGNIADVLSTGLVSEKDILRLRVMAEVKGFEHGLVRMGVMGGEQTTKTMKLIAKIIGGSLLVVGGILLLIIIRGIFLTGMSMGG